MGPQRPSLERGLSLVEILIGSALLLTVLGLLGQVIWSGLRISGKAMNRVDLVTRANFCLDTIATDLERSQPAGIVFEQSPTRLAMSVHRIDALNAFGVRIWEKDLVLHLWDGGEVVRSLRSGVAQTSPSRLSPLELRDLVSGERPRTLTKDVVGLKIEDQDESTLTRELPFEITVTLERQAQTNAVERVEFKKTIHIKNL